MTVQLEKLHVLLYNCCLASLPRVCRNNVANMSGMWFLHIGIRGRVGLQGNMDPGVLFGSKETIAQRVVDTVRSAQGTRHIMNLGHGVLVGTPEDSVAHFFEVGKTVNERL